MSSKFYRSTTSNVSDVEQLSAKITSLQNIVRRIAPLTYLLEDNVVYAFDSHLVLDFPKYSTYSDIRRDAGRLSFVSSPAGAKLKISIRLMYNWQNKDYAPRFQYNLVVNDVVVLTDNSDVNDSSNDGVKNASNIAFVHNFVKDDKVEIILTKPSTDNLVDNMIMFKNSNIEFNYF